MRPSIRATFVMGFGATLLTACGGHETIEKPPLPVRLQPAEASPLGGGLRYSANIAAKEQVSLAFKRSEEHTSELQSLAYLVCRLLLEKKKKKKKKFT